MTTTDPEVSSLINAFIRGLKLPSLTANDSVISKSPTKTEEIAVHAKAYCVTPRTISRWIARGLNPADSAAVAQYLTSIIHPSPAALRAVSKLLAIEISKLTENQLKP